MRAVFTSRTTTRCGSLRVGDIFTTGAGTPLRVALGLRPNDGNYVGDAVLVRELAGCTPLHDPADVTYWQYLRPDAVAVTYTAVPFVYIDHVPTVAPTFTE